MSEYDTPEARQAVLDYILSLTPEQLREARNATMVMLTEDDDGED